MSTTAIQVENVSKRYVLGEAASYYRFSELLQYSARAVARRLGRFLGGAPAAARKSPAPAEPFWALRDISFEVKEGTVLGIIGRNGAGKSTLLKILSRIVEPTTGRFGIRGRVASLLEVGTGFHPELTGRENIYLSGALLGMCRAEIRRQFDAIVDFAEIEKFIDTPVKHYSSGMYVRLGFAIAAHLRPDVLIVDEVLAVGDAAFQRKCMGRMDEVAKERRTVLFVSHNMAAVQRLCSQALLLENGRVAAFGGTSSVTSKYLEASLKQATRWERPHPYPTHPHVRSAYLCNADGAPCGALTSADHFGVCIEYCLPEPTTGVVFNVEVYNHLGLPLFLTCPQDAGRIPPTDAGLFRAQVMFPPAYFMPNQYSLTFSMYRMPNESLDRVENSLRYELSEGLSLANSLGKQRWGELQVLCDWSPFARIEAPDPTESARHCNASH